MKRPKISTSHLVQTSGSVSQIGSGVLPVKKLDKFQDCYFLAFLRRPFIIDQILLLEKSRQLFTASCREAAAQILRGCLVFCGPCAFSTYRLATLPQDAFRFEWEAESGASFVVLTLVLVYVWSRRMQSSSHENQ